MNPKLPRSEHAYKYDIVGVGNAIVDILAYTDDAFLAHHGLHKGAMTLVDIKRAKAIYKAMGTATECSGGSVANTMAGLASFGANVAFIGRIKEDAFGEIFKHDMVRSNVDFPVALAKKGKDTAHCLVLVTHEGESKVKAKNAERTMATYLGASIELSEEDIDPEVIKSAKITYLEGYLWDNAATRNAAMKAIHIAKEAGNKVGFTLSDPLCVGRHREAFIELVENHLDILFANEKEAKALFNEPDIRKILYKLHGKCEVVAVTRSAKGSIILVRDQGIFNVEAEKVHDVYDVTGAGDLYASGFLYGYVRRLPWEQCGKLGSIAAAQVIQYLGGRPLVDLSKFLNEV